MNQDIPKISFKENIPFGLEVMTLQELRAKLDQANTHDPYSLHKIEFFLILIITENTYTHFVDFESYPLTTGSAIFIAKNQVQRFNKLDTVDGFGLVFNSSFIDKNYFLSDHLQLNRLFNYHIESPVIHQQEMGGDSFIGIASKLYDEYVLANNPVRSEMLRALLHVLLLKAERAKAYQAISGVKAHWLETFNRFKNALEKEYVTSRTSRVYAEKLGVSYKYLNDIVKNLTGKTAKAFIDDFVTVESKRYLVSTGLSVKEISYQTGFDEPSNFIKFFKKHTDRTPIEFRQQF